jgi:mannose-1-phosphate guanylyltransferase
MRHAVIMAGGGGTRLWPASRRARPKQLLPLGSRPGETLLGATVRRLAAAAAPERTWIVTSAALAGEAAAAAPGVSPAHVLGEPLARNTAAALGLAAVHLCHVDASAVMAALPADHHIGDEPAFAGVVDRAFTLAETRDAIVTVGLRPTRPDTGFGYLELGAPLPGAGDARAVARFVEKPDLASAERYVASGQYLWNGGMFFLAARRLLAEIERHLPALAAGLAEIAAALRQGPAAAAEATARVYPTLPSISIDHGVMEKAAGLVTVPGDFGWNDVGAFSALADVLPPDQNGNFVRGLAVTHDAQGNVVVSDDATLVALVGVSDLVVVRAGDAVLVMPRERAQDVKEIVKALEARGLERFL